jgi:hypothetical protein
MSEDVYIPEAGDPIWTDLEPACKANGPEQRPTQLVRAKLGALITIERGAGRTTTIRNRTRGAPICAMAAACKFA